MNSTDIEQLDVFGQQGSLNIYTQICLTFPLPLDHTNSTTDKIVDTLSNGLNILASSFPWISCQVSRNDDGLFHFSEFEKAPRFFVKNVLNKSTDQLEFAREAGFPFAMFDEQFISPCNTFPFVSRLDGTKVTSQPVFQLQATFISGWAILTFVSHHQAMDMTGHGQIMHLLNKACYGIPFSEEELRIGNLNRKNIIPLLSTLEDPMLITAHQISRESSKSTEESSASWAYFLFSPAALSTLKTLAASTLSTTSSVSFVSTDDVLTAFVWQSISRVRASRFDSHEVKTKLGRAVDPRSFVGLPATYPGLVQNMTYHEFGIHDIVALPLGQVAADLRRAVDPATSQLGVTTRALATVLDRAEDKNTINVTASLECSSTDLMLSSWSKVECYSWDFNLGLGLPEAVRRPLFTPVPGLIYFMPRRSDGEIAVAISLLDKDLNKLKVDELFTSFARFVG